MAELHDSYEIWHELAALHRLANLALRDTWSRLIANLIQYNMDPVSVPAKSSLSQSWHTHLTINFHQHRETHHSASSNYHTTVLQKFNERTTVNALSYSRLTRRFWINEIYE